QLLRNMIVLVNPVIDLLWSVNVFMLRKTIHKHHTVMIAIVANTNPGNHVLSLLRRIWLNQNKFFLIMFRKCHRYIVWLHYNVLVKILFGWKLPKIFSIIENF